MDMVQVPEIAVWSGVGAASGVIAYAVTEGLKWTVKGYVGTPHPRWWQGIWRLVPMLIGGLAGWALWGAPWGCAIGTGGGALSALIYRTVRKRIEEAVSADGPGD